MLGGVTIDGSPCLAGHSDGDAVAHAVADALLGPAGLPDLGTLFPASDEQYRGANSMELLADVARRLAKKSWWIENVDVMIAAEQPMLAPHVAAMAANLAAVLAPAREPMGRGIATSVKPKRAEGLGAIGRAEGIAVWAVAARDRAARNRRSSPQRLASLRSCSASTTPLSARWSTSRRASRARCRCTSAARRRTTCRTSGTAAPRCRSTSFAAISCGRVFAVTFVSNVTDIEDKIIARAQRENVTEPELARTYEDEYWKQMDRLNVMRPDEMPRATEFIPQMQALIAELVASGRAYVVEGQGVYFQVDTFPEYGKLSHRTLADLLESAGARVEVDERKRSPVDFALWKAAKPGEPQWESPWGPGRPGWHIECSAMSLEILGEHFDLHGGGTDLEFPHHENEIAQAEGAGHPFARHWIHSAMVNVDGEKMSKSLGNFTTLADVLDRFDPRAFRLLVLQTHYRRQMEVGEKELSDAEKAVEKVDTLMRRVRRAELPVRPRRAPPKRFAPRWTTTSTRPPRSCTRSRPCATPTPRSTITETPNAAQLAATVREVWSALGLWWLDDDEELDDEIARPRAAARRRPRPQGLGRSRSSPRRVARPRHRVGRHERRDRVAARPAR